MRDGQALRAPLAIAALLAGALLAIGALVRADRASLLVPRPEHEAEGFVKALAAHDAGAARHALGRELKARVGEDALGSLARALDEMRPALADARGLSSAVQGKAASASVEVRLADGRRRTLVFDLEKETGLWKLASIDPALALAGGR
jgi:hypothetical protein